MHPYTPKTTDLSLKTKRLWSGQASLRSRISESGISRSGISGSGRGGSGRSGRSEISSSGRKNLTKTICLHCSKGRHNYLLIT